MGKVKSTAAMAEMEKKTKDRFNDGFAVAYRNMEGLGEIYFG
jgi:hypothetical protein